MNVIQNCIKLILGYHGSMDNTGGTYVLSVSLHTLLHFYYSKYLMFYQTICLVTFDTASLKLCNQLAH